MDETSAIEELQKRLDERLDQQKEASLLELQKRIDERIDKQFDRDRQFIKDTIGAALKVLGGAIAFVALILTVLGYRTTLDIQNQVTDAATKVFEKRVTDPSSSESQTIETLLNRTLVDSLLLRLLRSENDHQGRLRGRGRLSLDEGDERRLLNILKDPNTDAALFSDASRVLIAGRDEHNGEKLAVFFRDLIDARPPDFAWISEGHDSRREGVLARVTKAQWKDLEPAEKPLILDTNTPKQLRVASIKFAGEVRDPASNRVLINA